MKFRTRFQPHKRFSIDPNVHPDTGEICKSLTRQEHASECDINSIMERYERTGELPGAKTTGQFTYCPSMDYQECLALVQSAQSMFDELPSRLRAMYDNDPARDLSLIHI